MTTVIEHVLDRLTDLGVRDIFGVPGDYAFPVNDAVSQHHTVRWVGCCNELNAAYAADGYARIHGLGALSTTYGVGELSAMNGVAGAYAENVPLFHLVGMPSMPLQTSHALVHHTLGNGEFDLFSKMSSAVVCAGAIMTPQNVASEVERLIADALYHRRPVYMAFPADLATMPVASSAAQIPPPTSNPANLRDATDAIVAAVESADTACVLPGVLTARVGLRSALQDVIDRSGLPFATMVADKAVLDEQQSAYVGIYDGRLMDPQVRTFVETCDVTLVVSAMMHDFNSGKFTSNLDATRIVSIHHHHVEVCGRTFANVEMHDVLESLSRRLEHRDWPRPTAAPTELTSSNDSGDGAITTDGLYWRWQQFLEPDDILVAETGTASMGLASARMPRGAVFHNQTLWGSIGWATPAAFGAAVAAGDDRRVVLVTGEGSHQLTAQEIGQFGRLGLRPVVFVLNNSGYLIERIISKLPSARYNDLAEWRYTDLPRALGCVDWFTARVTTCSELDAALEGARNTNAGVYIEVVTGMWDAPPLAEQFHESEPVHEQA